jgi:hypothetical protein
MATGRSDTWRQKAKRAVPLQVRHYFWRAAIGNPTRMRPPVVKGNDPPATDRSSVLASDAPDPTRRPDLVSESDTGRCPAPNTYRGSQSIQARPAGSLPRDLETHACPRAVPVKGVAGGPMAPSSYGPGSGEGQDERYRDPVRRHLSGAGRPANQPRGLPGVRPSAFLVVDATCILASFSAPRRLIPLRLQLDRGLDRPLLLRPPGTSACRRSSGEPACSRPPGPTCGPGWRAPWPCRTSAPGASCT